MTNLPFDLKVGKYKSTLSWRLYSTLIVIRCPPEVLEIKMLESTSSRIVQIRIVMVRKPSLFLMGLLLHVGFCHTDEVCCLL